MDPATSAAIGGGASVASSVGQGIFGYLGQRSANKTNLKLAQQARDHDVNMWNRQNEYNTPAMQMQRLKEAGLNPNLIYEGGAGSMGNASAPQKSPVPEVSNELASLKAINIMPAISLYQDWQVKRAQIDNLEAQREAITEQTIGKRLENYMMGERKSFARILAENEASLSRHRSSLVHGQSLNQDIDWQRKQRTFDTDVQIPKYQLQGLQLQNKQRKLEISLDEQLKPYGMHKGDELWQRILLPVLMKAFDPRDLNLKKFLPGWMR